MIRSRWPTYSGTMELPILEDVTEQNFREKVHCKRRPVVIRGVDIGPCTSRWSAEYLARKVSSDKQVQIHVCTTPNMDFIHKNFMYRSLPFPELVRRASNDGDLHDFFMQKDEKYYMRAIGVDPRKDIANFHHDFPELADDIQLPAFCVKEELFSSVMRLASKGIQLWTHYDVMDNILIQVQGHKRAVLFPPSDANYLYLSGDKSEVQDIDKPDLDKYPLFSKTTRYETILQPGDILFIPALWFHNVISLDFGVAVNVFWRHLGSQFYDQKDLYGNKDLVPATRAMQCVNRAIKILEEMPEEYRDFYARRLVIRLEDKGYSKQDHRSTCEPPE